MASVNSTMQALGTCAAPFILKNVVDNKQVSLGEFSGKPLLIMFICNHCPYVIHIIEKLSQVANDAQANGFAVVAISSNDELLYPQDNPEAMQAFAEEYKFEFGYLFDATQEVAKAYGAACTPDFFIFDAEHKLQYRGQMDDSRPGNSIPVSANDLQAALTAVLAGQKPKEPQTASIVDMSWGSNADTNPKI